MTEIIDRRYLLVKKYLALRDEYGHEGANARLSRQEKDDIFNYIVSCSTPQNHDKATGGFIIRKHISEGPKCQKSTS